MRVCVAEEITIKQGSSILELLKSHLHQPSKDFVSHSDKNEYMATTTTKTQAITGFSRTGSIWLYMLSWETMRSI